MRAWLLALALLYAVPSMADLEILDLQHRTGEELLPLLRPVAPEGVAIQATGYRLVVRGEPDAIAEVQSLVQRLDSPAASVRISVRTVRSREDRSVGAGASGEIGPDGARGRVHVYSSRDAEAQRGVQTVRALSGRPAYIDTGGSFFLKDRVLGAGRDGAFYGEWSRRLDRPDGFVATARVRDDHVRVDIAVEQVDAPVDDAQSRRRVVTAVEGTLGEWLTIARQSDDTTDRGRGTVHRSDDASRRDLSLQLRVERVSP